MIKLINYKGNKEGKVIYLAKSVIGEMRRNDEEGITYIWSNDLQPTEYVVKESPEEILAMPDIETTEKVIDWEQRRYEIAKEISGYVYNDAFVANDDYTPCELIARDAIKYADALINELKKGQDNEN